MKELPGTKKIEYVKHLADEYENNIASLSGRIKFSDNTNI